MTDHPNPPSDEDLSAAIDGEADADALARLAAHPDASARSDELEAASGFLRSSTTPELDADQVDELVAAALDAPVAPAAPAGRAQPARWLVAAVIAVLVGVGLTLVWVGRDSGTDQAAPAISNDVASEAPTADGDEGGAGASAFDADTDARSQDPAAEAASDAGPLLELGTFGSGAALREALADTTLAEATAGAQTSSLTPVEVARCADQLGVILDLPNPPEASASAVVDGTSVLVYEFAIESFDDGEPTTLVAAVDAEACAEVVVFER